mmetsp:Transcript_25413/g.76330  ORF Transcript_25413/g.76330 Transcript_25413/m.76330 type:complete len:416 (-) Transcript_25413:13-1260(-)
MRRRGVKDEPAPAPRREVIKNVEKVLKSMDVYSNNKVAAEFTTPETRAAGKMTKASYWVMLALFICELRVFMRVEERDHVVVDRSLGQKLRIGLNVSFPRLTCAEVHLDAMDVAGDYHPYMEQHMVKQRLDAFGEPIHPPRREVANEPDRALAPGACLSCYGAETEQQKCCNTCDDLLRAYGTKGWGVADIKKEAPQCADERVAGSLSSPKKGEGCRLAGWLEVNKVAGNVHVAMGESAVQNGRFIHQFDPTHAHEFDVSHDIHELRFGDPYERQLLPLEGVSRRVTPEAGTGLFQYFVKLVPTIYRASPDAEPHPTVRYSYTQRFRPLKIQPQTGDSALEDHNGHAKATSPTAMLPGVFFVYDFSAFMVEVTRHRTPFSHLLVRVCAIVGGVSTVVAFLDWLLRTLKAEGLVKS